MATAPKPGGIKQVPTLKITVRDVAAIINPGEFGPKDDSLVRRESMAAFGERVSLTGVLQEFDSGAVGLDSLCLLWWLARRKAGETDESLSDALDSFPTYAEFEGAVQVEVVEDDSGN